MAAPTDTTELARRFRIDVDTAYPGGGPTWVQLKGVTDWKPSIKSTLQESSDYDGDWVGMEKTKLALTAEVTFLRKKTIAGDVPNAAQETLRAAETEFGEAGLVHVRWYDRNGGDEAYEGYFHVEWSRANSGQADLDAVSVTLTDYGQGRIEIANPAA